MSKWYISRQKYWGVDPEDGTIVEVVNGRDYANPDQLCDAFKPLGEGREFSDVREACECAINICEAWRKTNKHAQVSIGATLGFTMPFSAMTYDELRERAEKIYDKAPKCEWCAEPLPDKRDRFTHDFADGYVFCSNNCAESSYYEITKDDENEEDD